MKKITLLFATLLSMFGDAFGQKEAKVLWEREVLSTGIYSSQYLRVSPNGNTFLDYNRWAKVYDTNGVLSWQPTDIIRNSNIIFTNFQPYGTVLKSYGFLSDSPASSIVQIDKDFKVVKNWSVDDVNKKIVPLEDGCAYFEGNNTIVKHDADGKEQWTHVGDDIVDFATKTFPYIGVSLPNKPNQKPKFVIFNKEGKKTGITETPQNFNQIFGTKDNGFWLLNYDYEYIKFDSTGKATATFTEFKNIKNWIQDKPSLTADNSLVIHQVQENGFEMIKLSPSGKIDRVFISAPLKYLGNSTLNFQYNINPNQNKVMYALPLKESNLPEANMKCKIGVIDFDNISNSWNKDIYTGTNNDITGFPVTFEAENTFFVVVSSSIQPNIKKFNTYDVKGNLTWESSYLTNNHNRNPYAWKIVDNHIYFNALVQEDPSKNMYSSIGSVKIRFTDGKLMWNKKEIISLPYVSINKVVQKNKYGEDVILFQTPNDNFSYPYSFSYMIANLNDDGTNKWNYTVGSIDIKSSNDRDYFSNRIAFQPTEDDKLIVYLPKKNDDYSYFLRKVSFCTDITATATASATEACPTEKVKLSIPKQEGITYQWQKDGKDLPNLTDAVYDFGESGIYTVVVKDEICQNQAVSNALKINIRQLPTAQISAPKSTFVRAKKPSLPPKLMAHFFNGKRMKKTFQMLQRVFMKPHKRVIIG